MFEKLARVIVALLVSSAFASTCLAQVDAGARPIKVFILAGDELVLESAVVKDKKPDTPGTLIDVVAEDEKYAPLKDAQGDWVTRNDVLIYDAHPIQNNTKAPARPLSVGEIGRSGPEAAQAIGPALMLGHTLGDAFDEPVLIIRFGTKHPTWFRRGSRDLSHDFRPPSSGGGNDLDGSWDVIHFNHGVHDTAHRDPANYKQVDEDKFPVHIPIEEYEANLKKIVAKLKKTGATLIWARTTPVRDDTPGWKAKSIDEFNAVADRIMRANGVIINDLHAESIRQGFPKRPNVHSVGNLAPKTTEVIEKALADRENKTKPLPRVLMIGDSITGGYWAGVQRNLDGKAVVFKNPANGGNSRFGLKSVDEWLDLERYLLNGAEYLLLTSGVREAMANWSRVCPQHPDRKAELAGLIWFQGEQDSQWDSKAAAYERQLANLIRDLRKDLDAPNLPVVVTALAKADGNMTPNQQKVFDAQMAVGDKEKYPAFAGNVISIDTRPMAKPAAQSPGGRDRYKGNARAYLEIGQAMAEAMLKLYEK